MINHLISDGRKKIARLNTEWWARIVPEIVMCRKLRCDHTNKLYIYKPASVLENETYKLLRDFKIETDHLISPRRLDLRKINQKKKKKKKKKRTCRIVGFSVRADHWVKLKESEKKDKYLDLVKELKYL